MLALDNNNELYRSHVELKRKMVELCIQAVLADMKDSSANPSGLFTIFVSCLLTFHYAPEIFKM